MNLFRGKKKKSNPTRNVFRIVSFFIFFIFLFNLTIAAAPGFQNNTAKTTSAINTLTPETHTSIKISLTKTTHAAWDDGLSRFLRETSFGQKWKSTAKITGDKFADAFFIVIDWTLYNILEVLAIFVRFGGIGLDMTLNQEFVNSTLVNNDKIYLGWQIMSSFLNLFFILALLFSAFATIFQVEKYHLKKIIVLLVVMALLVNFSYPISLFIIDFSNSAMFFISAAMFPDAFLTGTGAKPVSPSARLAHFTNSSNLFKGVMGQENNLDRTTSLIMGIIFMFLLAVTLMAFSLNLILRLFILSLLIVFSPAGFALLFFPGTRSLADSWWNNIIKYALMGPIMLFFLMFSLMIYGETPTSRESEQLLASMIKMLLPISFLWVGLIASQKFGGAASGTAMNFAKSTGNRIRGMTAGLGKGILSWGDRQLASGKMGRVGQLLSPMAWKTGWKARQARLDRDALMKSQGFMENVLERGIGTLASVNPYIGFKRISRGARKSLENLEARQETLRSTAETQKKEIDDKVAAGTMTTRTGEREKKRIDDTLDADIKNLKSWSTKEIASLGGILKETVISPSDIDRTDRDRIARQQLSNEKKKLIEDTSPNTEYRIKQLQTYMEQGDREGVVAMMQSLAASKDLNDLVGLMGDQYGDKTTNFSPTIARKFLKDFFKKQGFSDEEASVHLRDIGEISTNSGLFALAGMSKYDPDAYGGRGGWVENDDEGQADIALAKFREADPQVIEKMAHRNNYVAQNKRGEAIRFSDAEALDPVNKRILEKGVNPLYTKHVGRGRPDRNAQVAEAYHKGIFNDAAKANPEIHKYSELAEYGEKGKPPEKEPKPTV